MAREADKDSFEVATDRARGVVTVAGDLDLAHCQDLRLAILAVEETRPPVLVVDLREVVHIDSTGLRVILDASTRAEADGRRVVVVVEPGGPVGKVLELTLVTDRIEVVGDPAAAQG
ncbi:MAG TPA: STAS domain-containing protein [Miltoncostaeaceae bacterium]|nr:STAS domain-containing protein [Miltoncostaeaceae bacterium]